MCGTWREPLVVGTSTIDREPRSFPVRRIFGPGLRALGVSNSLAFSHASEPDVGRSRFKPRFASPLIHDLSGGLHWDSIWYGARMALLSSKSCRRAERGRAQSVRENWQVEQGSGELPGCFFACLANWCGTLNEEFSKIALL